MTSAANTHPTLTGSPKQVAWGEDIRSQQASRLLALRERVATQVRKPALADYITTAIDRALAQDSARFWIDYKDQHLSLITWLQGQLQTAEAAAVLFGERAPDTKTAKLAVDKLVGALTSKL